MSETWFSDNFGDLSRPTGVEAGFQFEFYCERCRNAYRTVFEPYKGAQAAGWLGRAAGMFGGVLGDASNAAEGVATQNFGRMRDEKFRNAVVEAKAHFHRCAQCFQYVCDQCFNAQAGLCLNCAPDAEVAIEAARAQGQTDAARNKSYTAGQELGAAMDVKRDRQLVCPKCNAETHGAKFCPECGERLATTVPCPGCQTDLPPGTKFCPECGMKLV